MSGVVVSNGYNGPRANRGGNSSVYQIDFTAVASGKHIASTKRRVRWRFGFTNMESLDNGETGTSCRGEEHDIVFVWSITSGKRVVMADGAEVHYSNSRSGAFDFTWTMRGNHVLKIIAYASLPLSGSPGFKQYDFFVDGQSYNTFPKVFRLGLQGNGRGDGHSALPVAVAEGGRPYTNYSLGRAPPLRSDSELSNPPITVIETPHTQIEEQAYLEEAIKNSLRENIKKEERKKSLVISEPIQEDQPSVAPAGDDMLLDFFDAPASAPSPAAPLPARPDRWVKSGIAASAPPTPTPTAPSFAVAPSVYSAPSPPTPNFATAPSVYSAPSPPGPTNFATAPSVYASPPASTPTAPNFAAAPVAYSAPPPHFAAPPVEVSRPAPPNSHAFAAPVGAVANPFDAGDRYGTGIVPPAMTPTPTPAAAVSPTPIAPPAPTAGGLDDIFSKPAEPQRVGVNVDDALGKLMSDFSLGPKDPVNVDRANPFDAPISAGPISISKAGPAPTLAGMKMSKPEGEKKDVMKAAMVVSGNQGGNWGAAAAPGGYGQNYGYGQQQPPQPAGMNGYGQQQPPQMAGMNGYGQQQPPPSAAMNGYGGVQAPPQQQYQQPQYPPQGYANPNMQYQQQPSQQGYPPQY